VIGREQTQYCLRILPQQQKRGQPNRRSCISSRRFSQDLRFRELRELLHDCSPQIFVGDDPEPFRPSQRQQARHGLLNHRLLAVERQQLFRALPAAQRPEARAAPASQNNGIEIRVLSHKVSHFRLEIVDFRLQISE